MLAACHSHNSFSDGRATAPATVFRFRHRTEPNGFRIVRDGYRLHPGQGYAENRASTEDIFTSGGYTPRWIT
jgi:hypothetical protein